MHPSRSTFYSKFVAVALFAVVVGAVLSCTTTEGERCNASLSHDECASGLACTVPTSCSYAVCCPADGRKSSSRACDPCAATDAGEESDGSAANDPTDAAEGD